MKPGKKKEFKVLKSKLWKSTVGRKERKKKQKESGNNRCTGRWEEERGWYLTNLSLVRD